MDIRSGLRLRVLALFRKLREIRRFLLRRVYRSLAHIADHGILWAYQAAAGCVSAAQPVSYWPGGDTHVASGREQIFEEQLPLPPGVPEDAWVRAWPSRHAGRLMPVSAAFASLLQLGIEILALVGRLRPFSSVFFNGAGTEARVLPLHAAKFDSAIHYGLCSEHSLFRCELPHATRPVRAACGRPY